MLQLLKYRLCFEAQMQHLQKLGPLHRAQSTLGRRPFRHSQHHQMMTLQAVQNQHLALTAHVMRWLFQARHHHLRCYQLKCVIHGVFQARCIVLYFAHNTLLRRLLLPTLR